MPGWNTRILQSALRIFLRKRLLFEQRGMLSKRNMPRISALGNGNPRIKNAKGE
jgi:hypothetical protein